MPPEVENQEVETTTQNTSVEPGVESTENAGQAAPEVQENAEAGSEGSGEAEGGEEGAGASPTAFKPKLKFKADDKEYEIPQDLAGLIKDEKTEARMIELLQKSYGLDAVKTRSETVRQQRDEFKEKLGTYDSAIKELRDHYSRGDIDMWIEKMKVDPNKMLKWALDKVSYSQLTPEQKAIRDAEVTTSRRAYELEQQNVQLQSQNRDTQVQAMQTALNYEFGKPDVDQFREQFDSKVGKPGAFFDAVRQKGQSAFTLSGGSKNMTPAEAVAEVMKDYSGFFQASSGTQANPNAPKVVQANPGSKSTIPNVQGKQSSPVGNPKPKNLKELRAIANKAAV